MIGWDQSRLSMVLAVLEARCGVAFAGHDVYLNVAGGLRISETGSGSGRRGGARVGTGRPCTPARRHGSLFGEISASQARFDLCRNRNHALKKPKNWGFWPVRWYLHR